jgi:multiple sugar transport system substrate-binding protein
MRLYAVLGAIFIVFLVLWVEREVFVRPNADVELHLMIWGTPDEVKTVRDYVDAFRQKFPTIEVKIQPIPDQGYAQKLRTRFQGGDPPDVFYLDIQDFPGVATRGWLLPLDELIARDKQFDPGAFIPEVYERFRWEDGKLYGVAKDFATLVLYYNKDLFDKYDVPYPTKDWTWDEFLDKARKLTHEDQKEFGVVLETWPGEWFPWVWSAGGKLVEKDGDTPRWVMGAPAYIEQSTKAFQFLSDLIWKYEVEPNPSVTRDQGVGDLFRTGKIGMCTYGRWKCLEFCHIRDFDWDVVELPRDKKKATTLFDVSYSIARDTKHPIEAWELLKFLTSEEAQTEVARSGHAIPSLKSIAHSDAFLKPKVLEGMNVDSMPNLTSVAFAETTPLLVTWNEVREKLRVGLDPLWNGTQRDARAVVEALQKPLADIVATEKAVRAEARGQ